MTITLISGLWDLKAHTERHFEKHYLPKLSELLSIEEKFVLFLPKEMHGLVDAISARTPDNTVVNSFSLDDLVDMLGRKRFAQINQIRTSERWRSQTGDQGWLVSSPQAQSEYYSAVTYCKLLLVDRVARENPFRSDYFYWIDAGITHTVSVGHLRHLKMLPNFTAGSMFLSFPYQAEREIHGFDYRWMLKRSNRTVINCVCRGGLFGGDQRSIGEISQVYGGMIGESLDMGLLGTEESLFTILSALYPKLFQRIMIKEDGLIYHFFEEMISGNLYPRRHQVSTNLYILTYNHPKQLRHQLDSLKASPEWLYGPAVYLIDNSIEKSALEENERLCLQYGVNYLCQHENRGICGGRQLAAEHFDQSQADYMFFFEDDMIVNSAARRDQWCRNGFRRYVANLYWKAIDIIIKEQLDFVKLSFTEIFMDNHLQCSWYNVPQNLREEFWPDNCQIPEQPIDYFKVTPLTRLNHINRVEDLAYTKGEVYYSNWPMIIGRTGNSKIFIETKWKHPYEQTWMSHVFQKSRQQELATGVLLASPISHERIDHYPSEERREN
jgi:hypothetical protein